MVGVAAPTPIAHGMLTMRQDTDLHSPLAQSGRVKALRDYRLKEVLWRSESVLEKALARTIHERTVNVLWVGTRLPKMVTPA